MKKQILVLTSRDNFTWWSMQEIIPAIEKVWENVGKNSEFTVHIEDVSGIKVPGRKYEILRDLARRCHYIVATASTPSVMRTLTCLRRSKINIRTFIYIHGDATSAFLSFDEALETLKEKDSFIVSCEADAQAIRYSFKNPDIRICPFPLCDEMTVEPVQHKESNPHHLPLLYVGRVSEQKNLHNLLLAMWILKEFYKVPKVTLDIFGREDGYGSPNMDYNFPNYTLFLKGLSVQLNLTESIRWNGFKDRNELNSKIVKDNRFIFVTPTLHSDENFGASALASLLQGSQAVITRWGGHPGFKKYFPKQLSLVPVYGGPNGPFINPFELAQMLFEAHQRSLNFKDNVKVRAAAKEEFSTEEGARKVIQELSKGNTSEETLAKTDLLRLILHRRDEAKFPNRKLYTGYSDLFSVPYFRAYGMTDTKRNAALESIQNKIIIPPWVQSYRHEVRITDPHRGWFTFPHSPQSFKTNAFTAPDLTPVEMPISLIYQMMKDGFAFPVTEVQKSLSTASQPSSKSVLGENSAWNI